MREPGRYEIRNQGHCEPNNRAPSPDGTGFFAWGPSGETDRTDDLREAQHLARTFWRIEHGRHRITVHDLKENDKTVYTIEASWPIVVWWRDSAEKRTRTWAAVVGPFQWVFERWTTTLTVTVCVAVAGLCATLFGIYAAYIKQPTCIENQANRCPCAGKADGWQTCQAGRYTSCRCP